jgi:NarL family two-component system sensor histidine kinase LiaS
VSLSLEDVPELVPEVPDAARRRVDDAIDALHASIAEMRAFIYGLRPLPPAGDLRRALLAVAEETERRGLPVATDEVAQVNLPPEVAADLVAIAREALSNATRHAGAAQASLRLMDFGDRVRLRVTDDGRGFDTRGRRARDQHGLSNIRDRAAALGGRATLRSRPGQGTVITVDIPVELDA